MGTAVTASLHFSSMRHRSRGEPAKRARSARGHFRRRFSDGQGQSERGEKLVAGRAGEQIIVPDHAKVSLATLNADPIPEAAVRAAADLTGAQELHETVFQAAANVVAELGRILMASLAAPSGRP